MPDTWRPYDPCNEPTERSRDSDLCASCGHPRVPHNYRHIFVEWDPSNPQSAQSERVRMAQQRMLSSEKLSCKLHADCREADELVRAAGGREIKCDHTCGNKTCLGCRVFGPLKAMTAHHEK